MSAQATLSGSFYQSQDYADCLAAAGLVHHTLTTDSGLVVAAPMQDGGFEIWEGPQHESDIESAWRWLLDRARSSGARYARMVLPIGLAWSPNRGGDLPRASRADTLLLATQMPVTAAILPGFLREARQAERHGVRVVETPFDSARFTGTYLALAKARGFVGEVDALEVLEEAAARGRITVLNALSARGELLAYSVLLGHEQRLETRYLWRLPGAGTGRMNRLIVGVLEHARARGIPFVDLGGLPSEADDALKGIGHFKASAGGVRHERSAFFAELAPT
jgi:hypothetical protein